MLRDPANAVADDHRCDAIDGPRLISVQQQELLCLRSAHVDCPRYRRAVASPEFARGSRHAPAIPRAIAASLVILALSAGISFGFVLARGGIDLPASATGGSAVAVVPSAAATPAASQTATPAPTVASQPPTAAPTEPPTPVPTEAPTEPPSAEPTPAPTETPSSTPQPTPSAAPSGGPSASRLAVLKPCPNQSGCYIYTIRSGDNLFSIAHWFGVPLDTIYAWNPTVKKTGIHPGMTIKIPTPTR